MKKVTKKATMLFVKTQLGSNKKWALQALTRIFKENQTADEQVSEITRHDNGIGFSGADGDILSSFAKQWIKWNRLSDKQMKIVFKKMPKYWKQVIQMSDSSKLEEMVRKSLDIQG
jgi:hypothetical protein